MVKMLKQIYSELDIPWSDSFETAVNLFMEDNSGFEKNAYKLSSEEEQTIQSILSA